MTTTSNNNPKLNLCCFLEISKNFIGNNNDQSGNTSTQQSQFEQQQALHLPISPYLIHQILRSEGFATKIMIFNKPALQNHNYQQQEQEQQNSAAGEGKDLYVRCLVQFETEEEAQKVLNRYGTSRQGVLVFLQTINCLMLRIKAKPSKEGQVFVTENTETTLAVTKEYSHFLGADFPRTVSAVQQQQQQQQIQPAVVVANNPVVKREEPLVSAAVATAPTTMVMTQTQSRVSRIESIVSGGGEEAAPSTKMDDKDKGEEADGGGEGRKRRARYQAPSIRQREDGDE